MGMKKISLVLILGIFLIGIVNASYCCEKTVLGAYCQNVDEESQCATGTNPLTGEEYKSISALCESTSYCKIGTCVNAVEGTCLQSPKIICEANSGTWKGESADSIAQCNLGCCLIGSNAAFVTKITCNKFSEMYGVTTRFQEGVTDETTCLANANPDDEGACVYVQEYSTTCERTTKEECNNRAENSSLSNITFHSGYLCTAEDLGSICSKPTSLSNAQTKCDDNGNVVFVDGCGNLANIYDSSKINDFNYWEKITESDCTDNEGNKNSATCGDCDYLLGSFCGDKEDNSVDAGDYICKNLDCVDYTGEYSGGGDYPRHGESWCETTGTENSVGSTDFKLLCMNGEVTIDECDSGRDKICVQNESEYVSGFALANCRKNYWEDCTSQNKSEECENSDARDCKWISYHDYTFTDEGLTPDEDIDGVCVPLYPPGFERDQNQEVIGGEICSMATTNCLVMYEKSGALGDYECVENCYCDPDDSDYDNFRDRISEICTSLGDCGVKDNYFEKSGKYAITDDEIFKIKRYREADPD
ncbi:hypothetical protein M0R72_09810 [Candidatus Pacearchaeota archaeon]|jgi:hypothetical protein|nr:hypothetical protein [Candidatus Pacearchaeota archaeon]